MKFLRPLLIGIGILAVVFAVTLVLAFLPSVQTWAVRRVIAGDPSLGVSQLGRVSVGLNRIEVTDVVVARPGLQLKLPSAVIELPLLSAARSDIRLKKIVAKGWTLDLTAPATAASSATAPGSSLVTQEKPAEPLRFEGVFRLLELPVDIAVEAADLDGTVIFPTKPGQPPGRAQLAVTGGQLAAGREGSFKITNDATLPEGLAPVSRLTTQSTLVLRMDTPRTFTRIVATNEVHASGPGLPKGARLHSETSLSRESGRESYAVLLKTIAAAGEKKLVELGITNPGEGKPFSGTWKFDVSDADLTPFALGHTLPIFALGAGGDFQADQRFQEIRLTGKTDLTTENLDSVYAGLSALGRLRIQSEFDLIHRASGIRVNRFILDLSGAAPVLAVKVLQAMEFVPATGEIKVAAPAEDLVHVSLKGLPLAWARPFTPSGLTVSGDDMRGEFVARPDQGGFAVRTVSPVQIDKLTVVQEGRELVRALDLSVALAGTHSSAGWQADVSEIAARNGGETLLTLALKAGQPTGVNQPIKATGRLRADLPALLSQPAAKEFSVLSRGTADFEFSASVTDALQQLSLKLVVTSLRSLDGKNLPAVASDLRADLHTGGRIELNVPLVFDLAGRKSDLDLSGSLQTVATGLTVDAQLLSRELYVDDLTAFAALQPANSALQPQAKPAPKSAPPSAPSNPAPDTKPVWDGITGNVKLALKKVVYAASQPPVEVSTSVKISPEVLTLESLNAIFPDGAAAKVEGVIKFQSGEAEPYDVSTNVSATNFDPQPFLQAANPGKPPTVEGKFDLTGKLTGRAASLDRIANTANVDAKLVSRGGQFHGFAASALTANIGKLQENTSKIGSVISLAGSVFGKSEVAQIGEKFRAGSDTIKRLVNFNFDQLNIDIAHRAGAATTEIKNFSILSPDMRLLGGGSIDNASGLRSILQSAMNLDLQMAVRGVQADDLRILNLLKKEADELGYTALLERFSVKGTPSQPNTMELIQQIVARVRG